jgi:hypothetical protein
MSQTFAENKIDAEDDKNKCCICYNDDSEEGNEGKLIECCSNKHILCIGCFHKSYERKCECPLCRELMFRPEIMTDVESFAYYGAKVAFNNRREREEQQRQIRLAEAERQQQAEDNMQREIRLAEAERQRAIAALNDRRARGLIRLAEAERQRDDRYARAREHEQRDREQAREHEQRDREYMQQLTHEMMRRIEANEDEDVTRDYFNSYMDSWHRAQQPVARPVQQPARPVQQPARPVQQPARPVLEPQPTKIKVTRIQIAGKSYLKTSNNLLYDAETKEEVGLWDPDTRTIQPLPEVDDSEDEVLPVAY